MIKFDFEIDTPTGREKWEVEEIGNQYKFSRWDISSSEEWKFYDLTIPIVVIQAINNAISQEELNKYRQEVRNSMHDQDFNDI